MSRTGGAEPLNRLNGKTPFGGAGRVALPGLLLLIVLIVLLVPPLAGQEETPDSPAPDSDAATQAAPRTTTQDAQKEEKAENAAGETVRQRYPTMDQIDEEYPGFADKKIRLPLSLGDAVRIAVRNNLDLEVEQYNRKIARRQIVVERAVFDPFFNVSYTREDHREPSVSPFVIGTERFIGVEVNPFEVNSVNSSLRGSTLLGTTYQLSVSESRFDNPEASLFSLNPRYSSRAAVTITQPLLRNAWYGINAASLRVARNNLRLSQEQVQLIAIDTVFTVVSAYWDLAFAHMNYQARLSALRVALEQLRIDRQKVQVGTLARIDITTSESQVARRKTEFDQAITQLENARDDLLVQMNYTGKDSLKKLFELRDEKSPFDNILVLPSTPAVTELVIPDRTLSLHRAFGLRPEYRRINYQIRNQDISTDVARNRLLPILDVTGTWTQLGLDRTLSDSIDSITGGRFYNWEVGVTLEFPLTYRGPINEYRNAQDELNKLYVQKQALENTIVIEVDRAIRDLQAAFRAVQNLHQEVVLQQALLEAEKTKLRVGKSIAYTVTQIENDLVDIQAQELRAKTDFEKAKAAYERAVGTLLDSHGIETTD